MDINNFIDFKIAKTNKSLWHIMGIKKKDQQMEQTIGSCCYLHNSNITTIKELEHLNKFINFENVCPSCLMTAVKNRLGDFKFYFDNNSR